MLIPYRMDDSKLVNWKTQVNAHHAQSIGVMDLSRRQGDFWASLASSFRDDPRRTDDPVLNWLLKAVDTNDTVMDVGGGAGRLAIPLAMKTRSTTVVEPSAGMVSQLQLAMQDAGVDNLEIIESNWESASVNSHDIVLCAHVIYGIESIESFVKKLHDIARKKVIVVAFMKSPQSYLAPMWVPVHGEARINLPGLEEFVNVLWELGIYPDVDMMPRRRQPLFESSDIAFEEVARGLFIGGNPVREERLRASLPEYLEPTGDGYTIKGTMSSRPGIVHWRTDV